MFEVAPLELCDLAVAINGEGHKLQVESRTTLLDLLRENLSLPGTKKGCDHGQCGACTVLVNGTRMNSCLCLAVLHEGAEIITIEGFSKAGELHALQAAFYEQDAYQCGYCTPGQICSAQGLINEGHAQTREEIRELMSGNLCRCGAYMNITKAVLEVLQTGGGR